MTCPMCGLYCPPDPETGYDCDELCRDCQELAEVIEAAFGDEEPDEFDQVRRKL